MRDAGVGAGSGFRPSVLPRHERENAAHAAAPQAVGEAHRDGLSGRQRGTSHCGSVPWGPLAGTSPETPCAADHGRPGHIGASAS